MRGATISMHPSCDARLSMRPYTPSLSSLPNLGGNIFNAYLSRQFYYQNTPDKQQWPRGKFTGGGRVINVHTHTHTHSLYNHRLGQPNAAPVTSSKGALMMAFSQK